MSTALDFMPRPLQTTLELKSFESRVVQFNLKEILTGADSVFALYSSYDPMNLNGGTSFKTLCGYLIAVKDASMVQQLVDHVLTFDKATPACYEQLMLAVEAVNCPHMASSLLEKLLAKDLYHGRNKSAKACCNIAMKIYKENGMAREGFRIYSSLIAGSSVNLCSVVESVLDMYSSIVQSNIDPEIDSLEDVLDLRAHYLQCCRPGAKHLSRSVHASSWLICAKFGRCDKLQEMVAAFDSEGVHTPTEATFLAKLAAFNAAELYHLSLREYDVELATPVRAGEDSLLARPRRHETPRLLLEAVRKHYLTSDQEPLDVDLGAFSQHFMRVLTLYIDWDMGLKFRTKHVISAALYADALSLIKDALPMYHHKSSSAEGEADSLKALAGLAVEKVLVSMKKRLEFVFPLPPPHLIVDYLEVCDLYSRYYEDPLYPKLLNEGFTLVPKLVSRSRSSELSALDKLLPVREHQRGCATDFFGDDESCVKLASIYCRNAQHRLCLALCMEYELENYANIFSGAVSREQYLSTLWSLHSLAIVTLLSSNQTEQATSYLLKRRAELHQGSGQAPDMTEAAFQERLMEHLSIYVSNAEQQHHEADIVRVMQMSL